MIANDSITKLMTKAQFNIKILSFIMKKGNLESPIEHRKLITKLDCSTLFSSYNCIIDYEKVHMMKSSYIFT